MSKSRRSSRSCVLGTTLPASCSSDLRYFSAACWQWKHTRSRRGRFGAAKSRAPCQSSSAFFIQAAVCRFINDFPLLDDLAQKPIVVFQPALDLLGGAHNEV